MNDAVSTFLAGVAGCQSDADGLNTVKNTNIKAPSSKVEETFGETGTEITLLLPRGASGVYEGAARVVRDGAALSVGELGNGLVFIKVVDVSGGAGAVPAAVSAAKARNSGRGPWFEPGWWPEGSDEGPTGMSLTRLGTKGRRIPTSQRTLAATAPPIWRSAPWPTISASCRRKEPLGALHFH